MKTIKNEREYNKALADVYALMRKGEDNLTDAEAAGIEIIAKAIQDYETIHYPFPAPKTITEMVALKMFERKINQTELSKLIGIGLSKLNQILKGKRPPDVPFLKAVHEKLGIDGNFILERV